MLVTSRDNCSTCGVTETESNKKLDVHFVGDGMGELASIPKGFEGEVSGGPIDSQLFAVYGC